MNAKILLFILFLSLLVVPSSALLKTYKVADDNGQFGKIFYNELGEPHPDTPDSDDNLTAFSAADNERIRFENNQKVAASQPIFDRFEVFEFQLNLTNSTPVTELRIYWTGCTEANENGLDMYIFDHPANQWDSIGTFDGSVLCPTDVNFDNTIAGSAIEDYVGATLNGSMTWFQVISEDSSGGEPGSPSIFLFDGGFQSEMNSYSTFQALEEWTEIIVDTNYSKFIISEQMKQETAYINGLEVFQLYEVPTFDKDLVFEGRMKNAPLRDISRAFFGNIDYNSMSAILSSLNILSFGTFKNVVLDRMDQELSAKYGDTYIRIKGNPKTGEYTTYRVKIEPNTTLEWNPNLHDVINIREERHVEYLKARLSSDFKPFVITEPEQKVVYFEKLSSHSTKYLIRMRGWYKPNFYIRNNDPIQSLTYFSESWSNPTYFSDIINESDHQSIFTDQFYLNVTNTPIGADIIAPEVTLLSPANNTLFYPTSENFTFQWSFFDFNVTTACSLVIDNVVNFTLFGEPDIMTDYFNHSTTVENFSVETNTAYEWFVNCTDQDDNEGVSGTFFFNISLARLDLQSHDPLTEFFSNSTLNTTWHSNNTLFCLDNNCGNVTITLQYNETTQDNPDTRIPANGTGAFNLNTVNNISFDNAHPLFVLDGLGDPTIDFFYDGAAWNRSHVFVISAAAEEIRAFNITDQTQTETIDISSFTHHAGGFFRSIAWDDGTDTVWFSNGSHAINIEVDGTFIRSCMVHPGDFFTLLAMTYGNGSLWVTNVTNSLARNILRIDPSDCSEIDHFSMTFDPRIRFESAVNSMEYIHDFLILGVDTRDGFHVIDPRTKLSVSHIVPQDQFNITLGMAWTDELLIITGSSATGPRANLTFRDILNPRTCNLDSFESCSINWTIDTNADLGSHFVDVLSEAEELQLGQILTITNDTINIEVNHSILVTTTTTPPVDVEGVPSGFIGVVTDLISTAKTGIGLLSANVRILITEVTP